MGIWKKGTYSRVFTEGDFAQLLDWDGLRLDNKVQIRGLKASVTGIMVGSCFREKLFKKDHVFSFLKKAIENNLVSKQEMEIFLNGEKNGRSG